MEFPPKRAGKENLSPQKKKKKKNESLEKGRGERRPTIHFREGFAARIFRGALFNVP